MRRSFTPSSYGWEEEVIHLEEEVIHLEEEVIYLEEEVIHSIELWVGGGGHSLH